MECPECGGVMLVQDGEGWKCLSCGERFPDPTDEGMESEQCVTVG